MDAAAAAADRAELAPQGVQPQALAQPTETAMLPAFRTSGLAAAAGPTLQARTGREAQVDLAS